MLGPLGIGPPMTLSQPDLWQLILWTPAWKGWIQVRCGNMLTLTLLDY